MKDSNITTPRTLADTQFTTGYTSVTHPLHQMGHKVLNYVYAFAFGFVVCSLALGV